jgi:hypothetical protein
MLTKFLDSGDFVSSSKDHLSRSLAGKKQDCPRDTGTLIFTFPMSGHVRHEVVQAKSGYTGH